MSSPSATYTSPSSTQEFTTSSIPPAELTTRGSTTGPSDFVLSKGAVDKDAPSEHKDTYLGVLRAQVTNLQDQINVYLTERMRIQKEEEKESEMEKKLLDGGDDDSDEEETKKWTPLEQKICSIKNSWMTYDALLTWFMCDVALMEGYWTGDLWRRSTKYWEALYRHQQRIKNHSRLLQLIQIEMQQMEVSDSPRESAQFL